MTCLFCSFKPVLFNPGSVSCLRIHTVPTRVPRPFVWALAWWLDLWNLGNWNL